MPWQEQALMSLRSEFIALASQPKANVSQVCRRFGISRTTAYKWLGRHQAGSPDALADRTRRPHHSPRTTGTAMTTAVLAVRQEHPAWGGRTIGAVLHQRGLAAVPSASTITAILRRAAVLDPTTAAQHRPVVRFTAPAPNLLWQMDFKGHIATVRPGALPSADGAGRPFPLQPGPGCLRRRADGHRPNAAHPALSLLWPARPHPVRQRGALGYGGQRRRAFPAQRLVVEPGGAVGHGRPYHPQTQGKDERFHRTLVAEVLAAHTFSDLAACQTACDRFRTCYNEERPHEALGLVPPSRCYHVSPRAYPGQPPPLPYAPGEAVRRVHRQGYIKYQGRTQAVGLAFAGQQVVVRPPPTDGVLASYFYHHQVGTLDCRTTAAE